MEIRWFLYCESSKTWTGLLVCKPYTWGFQQFFRKFSLHGFDCESYFSLSSLNWQGLWLSARWSQLELFSSELKNKSLKAKDTLRAPLLGYSAKVHPAQWLLPFCDSWGLSVLQTTVWRRWLNHALYSRGSVTEILIIQVSLRLLQITAAILYAVSHPEHKGTIYYMNCCVLCSSSFCVSYP